MRERLTMWALRLGYVLAAGISIYILAARSG